MDEEVITTLVMGISQNYTFLLNIHINFFSKTQRRCFTSDCFSEKNLM